MASTEASATPIILNKEDAIAKLKEDLGYSEKKAEGLLKTCNAPYKETEIVKKISTVKVWRDEMLPLFEEKEVNGKVTQEDAFAILKKKRSGIPDTVLKAMIHRQDDEGGKEATAEDWKTETVDVSELVDVFGDLNLKTDNIENIFKTLDESGDKFLQEEELVEELQNRCCIDSMFAYGMVAEADKDGDGKINLEEFVTMWTKLGL